jgi:NADPH:quinone reductase-like Zn-dependent oxidoreductase
MLAIVSDPDAPLGAAVREVPEPQPAPGEAIVELRATSLNRGEVRRLPVREAGTVPGWDVAGVVVSRAAEGGPAEGARVVGLVGHGAWAERVPVPLADLAELPDAVSFEEAATLPIAGLTALEMLEVAGLSLGKRVLVTGAAGGVGRFAIQLAHRAGGRVTAVVGSPERRGGLAHLGADDVIVGFEPDGGGEFDLILESAGGRSLAAALTRVALGGMVISFGNSSGEETTFNASGFYDRQASVRGFGIFPALRRKGGAARPLRTLLELVECSDLRTEISLHGSWLEPHEAMQALMDRRVAGKAVLVRD